MIDGWFLILGFSPNCPVIKQIKEISETYSYLDDKYKYYISIIDRFIGLEGRVFANGPGDLGSIPGRVIPKTLKMVLDTLLNTQRYKVHIKGKVEQSRERSSALPYTLV